MSERDECVEIDLDRERHLGDELVVVQGCRGAGKYERVSALSQYSCTVSC
ncbi:hypothetical protein ACFPH6_49040 [Streptomyces xiangluensis]|uniref:Uncharacterized protein n=1 Tax=Streptomyces xiangluensis TaxID=2665720 RepID=A0ABV8Z5R5_9ACTN